MRRILIKMRLIDSEMLSPPKSENAKTTMQESKALIMTYSKHTKEQMNYQNWLTQKNLN